MEGTSKINWLKAQSTNVLRQLIARGKLVYYLMRDNRVHFVLKLIPFGSLVYFVMPDLAIGPIDDATVLWLATTLFVELCPVEVVKEHKRKLGWMDGELTTPATGHAAMVGQANMTNHEVDVIDSQFTENHPPEDEKSRGVIL